MSPYPLTGLYPGDTLFPGGGETTGINELLTRDCIILERTPGESTSIYGDVLAVEATIGTVCELQQKRRDETSDRGETARSEWLLVLPADTVLRTGDAVIVDDETFEVIGEPWHARNPRTMQSSHVEATVARAVSTADPQEV